MARSHKIPKVEIAITAILFLIVSCNFQIIGIGSSEIATSAAISGMEVRRTNPDALMQCLWCFVRSQPNVAGVQLIILTSKAVTHHALMMPIRIYVVMRNLSRGKPRR